MTDIDQFTAEILAISRRLDVNAASMAASASELRTIADRLPGDGPPLTTPWRLPVGSAEHPAGDWYIYTHHDLTGRRNPGGYAHTGWDCNARWGGRGDADIGQPVFAVTDGEVVDVGLSETYRGGVVLKVDHFGLDLYVRYWHLVLLPGWNVGDMVPMGLSLGTIDRYPPGYAHCHFDMAWQPFKVNQWFTRHPEVEWANPTHILRAHNALGIDEILIPG